MSGIPTKLWPLDPHTAAKHEILRMYLNGWLPIMASHNQRIVYIDGFAGPGEYKGGEPGSPVVALDSAVRHILQTRMNCKASFYFIEGNKQRANHLRGILASRYPPDEFPASWEYEVFEGKCYDVLNDALDAIENAKQTMAPTLAFLDPFGYKDVPMSLVKRVMQYPRTEVMITFMAGFAHRFVGTGVHDEALRLTFGNDDWKGARDIQGESERSEFLLQVYVRQLKASGAKHVRAFEMRDAKGRVVYYFVYATGHPKRMEVIKQAMWKVDPRGTYRFSDRTDHNQSFITAFGTSPAHWGPEAMQMVCDRFAGETVSVEEVGDWVTTETPFMFQKRPILAAAERAGLIASVDGRKRVATFPKGCRITFSRKQPPVLA